MCSIYNRKHPKESRNKQMWKFFIEKLTFLEISCLNVEKRIKKKYHQKVNNFNFFKSKGYAHLQNCLWKYIVHLVSGHPSVAKWIWGTSNRLEL